MSSRDKSQSPLLTASSSRRATTKKTIGSSSLSTSSSSNTNQQTNQPLTPSTSVTAHKRQEKTQLSSSASSSMSRKNATKAIKNKTVIDPNQQQQQQQRRDRQMHSRNAIESSLLKIKSDSKKPAKNLNDESSSSSQEMTITSPQSDHGSNSHLSQSEQHLVALEQETNIDRSLENQATDDDESTTLLESSSTSESDKQPALTSLVSGCDDRPCLPAKWEEHTDKDGVYYWHVPTGLIQRTRPVENRLKQLNQNEPIVLYHDDEEINQTSIIRPSRTSSDEDDFTIESGAALTMADDTNTISDAISFVVHPIGCCEFDETELIANSTKAIQKCILRLSNKPNKGESMCWGLDQSQPILMRLMDDYIQFTDISTQSLLRSQPIMAIKTWAVDDDNNFAFVVEDNQSQSGVDSQLESVDYALLTGPVFMCYVFSSMDDDDMSVKVAAKLNKEINKFREQMANRVSKSTRLQQMVDSKPLRSVIAATKNRLTVDNDQTDADEDLNDQSGGEVDDDDDDLAESSEVCMNVRYIGKVQVPRPMGIDVLNVAIDKCLADASKAQMNRLLSRDNIASSSNAPANVAAVNFDGQLEIGSPLIEAKIHVSPSSVIVENEQTGEIIVECRIRYLTFMGISRRDIRWCGFIMQNTTNLTFVAYCFECHPTAGHVCEAIQMSCSRMYEKMVKRQRMKQQIDDATSIMPKSSKIRDTLAKTLSKIKLTPIT